MAIEALALFALLAHQTRFVGTVDSIPQEAMNRFRLEIVDDETTLAGASLDLVRQELVALIRARRPCFLPGDIMPPGSARDQACLVLDSEAISTISAIEVPLQYNPTDPNPPGS